MNHSWAAVGSVGERGPHAPIRARRSARPVLALIATGLLALGFGLSSAAPNRSSDEQPAVTGPVAWLLSASTDLGPARRKQISVAAALRSSARPQAPFAAIPGNHDRRNPMRKAFPDPTYGAAECPLNATRAVRGLDVVLVDLTIADAPHGELDAETLVWLDRTLAVSATRPALLFLHHPPFDTGIVYTDTMRLRNADALAAVLRRHPRALLVAAGHVHRAAQTVFAGISATICPAGEQAVTLAFEPRWPEVFQIEPPAFHLHAWIPGQRDLEAWSLTLCRSASFRALIPTATPIRRRPRYKRLFSAHDCPLFLR